MSFEKALSFTLRWEGGFCDHPADRGGATNFGIADARDGKKDGKADLDGDGSGDVPIKTLTKAQAAEIYRRDYWEHGASKIDARSEAAALCVFDAAVNHGPVRSLKLLRRAIGVIADGSPLDDGDMAALDANIHASGEKVLVVRIIEARERFYREIVERDASQAIFLKGWLRRTGDLLREAQATPGGEIPGTGGDRVSGSPETLSQARPEIQGAGEVAGIQRALRSAGFDPGPSDGVPGPRTVAALRWAAEHYAARP